MENANNSKKAVRILDVSQLETGSLTKKFRSQQVLLHKHLFFEFNVGLGGSFVNEINGEKIKFGKCRCAVLRPNSDEHRFIRENDKEEYFYQDVYVSTEKMKKCCDFLNKNLYDDLMQKKSPITFLISLKSFDSLSEKLQELNNSINNDSNYTEALHLSVITEILTAYYISINRAEKEAFPNWINILLSKINEDKAYLLLPETTVAKEFGYTTSHFSREFKKHLKMTYVKYINIKKAQKAAELLITTNKQVIEISQLLGYSSPSPFNKQFKEVFNCSPLKYRQIFTFK